MVDTRQKNGSGLSEILGRRGWCRSGSDGLLECSKGLICDPESFASLRLGRDKLAADLPPIARSLVEQGFRAMKTNLGPDPSVSVEGGKS